MNSKDLLLGIDVGTTGTKCTVYDLNGRIAEAAYQDYPMIHKFPTWTEQDPDVWWSCVCVNLRKCFAGGKLDSSRIAAIGLSCTNAVCLVDENGKVLHNAIGLHDQRSGAQVEWLEKKIGSHRIRELAANKLAMGSCALSSIRWILDNHPELIRPGCRFLSPSGFIVKRLTGEFSVNVSRVDLACIGNIYTGELEPEILFKADVPAELLPKVYRSDEVVGTVTRAAAEQTGLAPGTPVTAGSVDTVAATLGAGALNDGDLAITIGSSGRLCYVSSVPNFDERLINAHTINDNYLIIQTTNNAGVSLRWFKDTFGQAAHGKKGQTGDGVYDRINFEVEQTPAGADGMIYLPYLSGEKSPIWDTAARGVFFNISLDGSFGTFARAVMEGVAFSIRDCADAVMAGTRGDTPIPLGGGAANSRVWSQIFADVLGRPIRRLRNSETETLGDIIIAAHAAGIREIPLDFGKCLAESGELLFPNKDNAAMYDALFEKYKELYMRVKPIYGK